MPLLWAIAVGFVGFSWARYRKCLDGWPHRQERAAEDGRPKGDRSNNYGRGEMPVTAETVERLRQTVAAGPDAMLSYALELERLGWFNEADAMRLGSEAVKEKLR